MLSLGSFILVVTIFNTNEKRKKKGVKSRTRFFCEIQSRVKVSPSWSIRYSVLYRRTATIRILGSGPYPDQNPKGGGGAVLF